MPAQRAVRADQGFAWAALGAQHSAARKHAQSTLDGCLQHLHACDFHPATLGTGAETPLRLSEPRAKSVASDLTRQDLDAQRLKAVGKGFRKPMPGKDPLAPANRRVRIIAVD